MSIDQNIEDLIDNKNPLFNQYAEGYFWYEFENIPNKIKISRVCSEYNAQIVNFIYWQGKIVYVSRNYCDEDYEVIRNIGDQWQTSLAETIKAYYQ